MAPKAGHTFTAGPAKMRRRKDDFVKPDHLTFDQYLSRLETERADIDRQIRREVHTRGFVHSRYCERLDRAIIFARAAIAKTGGLSARTYHYDMAEPYTYTWPEGGTYYVMFNYFSFQNGKLNVGQCESVRQEDVPAVIAALEKNGRTRASYRYENGRAVLVTAAIAKTGGAA